MQVLQDLCTLKLYEQYENHLTVHWKYGRLNIIVTTVNLMGNKI